MTYRAERSLVEYPFDQPLDVDEIYEFHAARILLLLKICGQGPSGYLKGRTKLAKLDFFVRYPKVLEEGLKSLQTDDILAPHYSSGDEGVEAGMVRYRYGPWDHRYYDFIAMLHARGLIKIGGGKSSGETYSLTKTGLASAGSIESHVAFAPVVARCHIVAQSFARLSGTELKEFIYRVFQEEVAQLSHGQLIRPPFDSRD